MKRNKKAVCGTCPFFNALPKGDTWQGTDHNGTCQFNSPMMLNNYNGFSAIAHVCKPELDEDIATVDLEFSAEGQSDVGNFGTWPSIRNDDWCGNHPKFVLQSHMVEN